MTSQRRTTIAIVLAVVAALLLLGLAGLLIQQRASKPADPREQQLLQHQHRINEKLMAMHESSSKLLTLLSSSVALAVQNKDLNRRQVGILRDSLELFKENIQSYERDLNLLETDAQENLDGNLLDETLGNIAETRDFLGRLRGSHTSLAAALSQAFDTPLDRAIQNAYKLLEKALKELEEEQKKNK